MWCKLVHVAMGIDLADYLVFQQFKDIEKKKRKKRNKKTFMQL